MSDPDPTSSASTPPVIEHEPQPAPAPPLAPPLAPARRRGGTPLPLTLLLAAGLGGGLYWVWAHPQGAGPAAPGEPQATVEAARAQIMASVQAQTQPLGQQLAALSARVDALEKQAAHPAETPPAAPAPAPGVSQDAFADASKKLDDLSGRVDALSAKQDAQAAELQKTREIAAQKTPEPAPEPAQATAPPPPDTTAAQVPAIIAGQQAADQAIAQQKAASEQAVAEQKSALGGLEQRLAKLEAASGQAEAAIKQQQASQQGQTQLGAHLDTLDARLQKLEQAAGQAQSQTAEADKASAQGAAEARTQIDALTARVARLESGEGQVQGAARNASRAIRIEAAEAALASGQPLGALPDAPPALARFATVAPPTEAGLRAAFPQVADAARAASQPDVSQRSFLDRALARVQQSVTVRPGDRVLVGDPAAGVLARAQDALDAGDLKRAADILGGLNGPAAAAASGWVAQARSLVEARAALAAMARG